MNNIYVILDKHLKRIGTLDLAGATPFSNDSITIQLADADSSNSDFTTDLAAYNTVNNDTNINSKDYNHYGSITVAQGYPDSDKVVVGNHLAYYDDFSHHWYVMRIYYTSETGSDISGRHVTTAQLENIAPFDLGSRIVPKKDFAQATLNNALSWVMAGSQWEILNESNSALTAQNLSFSGTSSAWESFNTLMTSFDIEADCFVIIRSDGVIDRKIIKITDRLNDDEIYQEAAFGRNIVEATRNIVESQVATKLYVYGKDGVSIAKSNNGKAYIVDDDANENYNADYKNSYREKAITNDSIANTAALLSWGKRMLKLYNHPRYNYTVQMSNDFNPPIGVTIRVKDWYMEPQMTVKSRVIQKTFSKANPFGNTITLGEFVTVHVITPAWLVGELASLKTAVATAKNDASTIGVNVLSPDGTTFGTDDTGKRLILQARVGSENISAFLSSQGFSWKHLNTDGGEDTKWSADGHLLTATTSQIGTVRAKVNNAYIQDIPEVTINPSGVTAVGTYPTVQNGTNMYATQYIVQLSDGRYITSHHHTNDTWFCMWSSSFQLQSKMIVTDGGHGSSFGVEQSGSTIYIWANTKYAGSNWLSRFTYQANATLTSADINRYIEYETGIRVNYDPNHDMIGFSNTKGVYSVIAKKDVLAKRERILYTVRLNEDHGFDAANQTYQSQCLDFPYLYFHSGDVDMEDPRKIYGLNLVHQGDEFREVYDFNNNFKIKNAVREPEGISLITNADGSKKLLISFNTLPGTEYTSKDGTQAVFNLPLVYRGAVGDIDSGSFEEVD